MNYVTNFQYYVTAFVWKRLNDDFDFGLGHAVAISTIFKEEKNIMDIETYRNYCISKKAVTESFPFPSLPDVLVFKVANKMFTATNVITFESISVQCNTDIIDELRAKYPAIAKHKYFSERHWNLIAMDYSIADKLILGWIDNSYDLAVAKLTKKIKAEFNL